MQYKSPGHFRSAADFAEHLREVHADFDCVTELSDASGPMGQPLRLGEHTIGNRYAIHPMEGWDGTPDGGPTEHTLRRWKNFGRSGAKLIWGGEAFAVREDGRANPNQLYLNSSRDTRADLSSLRDAILEGHRESGLSCDDLFIGLQLTHSGRFSRPEGAAAPRTTFVHPILDERHGVDRERAMLSDGDLESIADNFIESAQIAESCGYDFVDVKCCHGYLLHELLSARSRPGPYGGSLEGRSRLLFRIIEGIQTSCPRLEIGVRISISDVFPYVTDPESGIGTPAGIEASTPYDSGFGLDALSPTSSDFAEPFELLRLLREAGVRLVNVTLGVPYYSPHVQRPAAYPPSDGYLPPEDPLDGVYRHIATVRACKSAFPDMVFVGSGYTYLQEWLPHVAEHEVGQGFTDFAGIGRMTLSYPQLPLDVLQGKPIRRKMICRTFSDCTTAPRNGLQSGCYPLDPYYKAMPAAERLRALRKDRSGA